ncbi:porin [Flavobacterium branchiophilum]|uniref:Phosphate-selective porin O/P n=1 Tax=Flavobacterium branchiophilum TaxID=55197 RepID=A0A543G461_9FLAO|nr:porin [Flavobacterium branchiophilum]OXA74616.1 porin [Flavobacterium branchiophilum] [Flavobacterium branchiophilum NBRC 15030 = ATCC 35035]TQM40876.1 phosphate-selective porin O/P [Flavobacterium branchiophilum]GEM54816.1 porin [Flavobacterium branchiophilum NBRC 15030 = ATCC 35035]
MKKITLILIVLTTFAHAQKTDNQAVSKEVFRILDSINKAKVLEEKTKAKKDNWFDKISLRGYAQIRYNGLFSSNDKVSCDQCDKSWGTTSTAPDAQSSNGFFIRRARLVFSGQIHPNVYVYIQPDLASSPSTGVNHFAQIRDLYADISFDAKKEYRVRLGQSKVPFGFENLQSSQNRLTLDRNDGLNSAVANERDLGAFFYWAPSKIRDRFAMLVKDGYKGSGDYGVFAVGAYNGQTANKSEGNRNLHIVSRISYPFEIKNQIIEPGLQAYKGKWAFSSEISTGVGIPERLNVADERLAASLILYPKPFGIQAEYNIGKGPRYDKTTNSVAVSHLEGGYVTLNYKLDLPKHQLLYPFAKFQYYDGGKKFEKDARSYIVRDYEIGLEWQPFKAFEFVAEWVISDRTFEDSALKNNRQKGNLLRIQMQFNF